LCFGGGQGTFALDKRIAGKKEEATMSTITPQELAGKIGETIGTSEWIL